MNITEVMESYWTICYTEVSIPCGATWCRGSFGIPYPCDVKWCIISIPYPCKKSRLVKKYCYHFSSVKDECMVFFESHYGCENGKEYKWEDGCLGWYTSYRVGVTICFDKPLKELGSCRGGYSLPHGDVPNDPQWQDGVAIGVIKVENSENIKANDKGLRSNSTFSPPAQVQKNCVFCIIGKIIVIAIVFISLIYIICKFLVGS